MRPRTGYYQLADHLDTVARKHATAAARRTGNDLATVNDDWSLTVDSLALAPFDWDAWGYAGHLSPQNPALGALPIEVVIATTSAVAVGDHGTHSHSVYAQHLNAGDRVIVAWTVDGTYPIVTAVL